MDEESKQFRISLIGPTAKKYKGGIAHFTSILAEKISTRAQCLFLSWYQPYPPFLTTRDFKDRISEVSVGQGDSEDLLGYLNPLSWVRTTLRIRKYRPSATILTWVHPVHAPVYMSLIFLLKLFSTGKIFLLCHNVNPHEKFPGAALLSRLVFCCVDKLIVHSPSEGEKLADIISDEKIIKLFHPIYEFPETTTAQHGEAENDTFKLLFFGVIREYKGLDLLLEAISILVKKLPNIRLTVAGETFEKRERLQVEEAVKRLGLTPYVALHLRYIPNEEVARFFNACDVVTLPYRSVTSSGPLTIAYHFGKPVIATNVGGMADYVEDGKSGYLAEPTAESIAEAIARYKNAPLKEENVRQVAKKFSWERYVDAVLDNIR